MKKQSVYTFIVIICMVSSYFFKSYFTFPTSYKTINSEKSSVKSHYPTGEEQDCFSILTDYSDENDSVSSKLNFNKNCLYINLIFTSCFTHCLKSEIKKPFILFNSSRNIPTYIAISVFRI